MDKPTRSTHGVCRNVDKDLRARVSMMLHKGLSPWAIRHEISADQKCTDIEKHAILRKLHMEVNHEEI